MAKNQNKTQATTSDPIAFLNTVEDEVKRKDSLALLEMMKDITGEEPVLWGSSIIGYGKYHYKYDSGREGDFMKVGFSPRKNQISIYLMTGFNQLKDELSQLGKHKTGKACLYIKKLTDVEESVLRNLIDISYRKMTEKYG